MRVRSMVWAVMAAAACTAAAALMAGRAPAPEPKEPPIGHYFEPAELTRRPQKRADQIAPDPSQFPELQRSQPRDPLVMTWIAMGLEAEAPIPILPHLVIGDYIYGGDTFAVLIDDRIVSALNGDQIRSANAVWTIRSVNLGAFTMDAPGSFGEITVKGDACPCPKCDPIGAAAFYDRMDRVRLEMRERAEQDFCGTW